MSPTLTLHAYYVRGRGESAPQHFSLTSTDFKARSDAEAFAALFPTAAKMRVETCWIGADARTCVYRANSSTRLIADDVNGGINETGVKRYHTIIRVAAKHSIPVVLAPAGQCLNAYESRAAFEQAVS